MDGAANLATGRPHYLRVVSADTGAALAVVVVMNLLACVPGVLYRGR